MDNISNWQAGVGLFVPSAQKLPVTERAAETKAKEQSQKHLGRFDEVPVDSSGLTSVQFARAKEGATLLHVNLPQTSSSRERQASQPIPVPYIKNKTPAGTRSGSSGRNDPGRDSSLSAGGRLPPTQSVRQDAGEKPGRLPQTSSTRGVPVPSVQQPLPVQTRSSSTGHVESGTRSTDAGKTRPRHPEKLRPVPSTAPVHSSDRGKAGSRSNSATMSRRDVPPNTPYIGPTAEDAPQPYRTTGRGGLRTTGSATQSPLREVAGARKG